MYIWRMDDGVHSDGTRIGIVALAQPPVEALPAEAYRATVDFERSQPTPLLPGDPPEHA